MCVKMTPNSEIESKRPSIWNSTQNYYEFEIFLKNERLEFDIAWPQIKNVTSLTPYLTICSKTT